MSELNLTEQDLADLKKLGADEPVLPEIPEVQPRTLLEVWQEILSNIEKSRLEHVDPVEATRIIRAWNYLKFQEIPRYTELFFDYLAELREVLHVEIQADPAALKRVEDDAEANRAQYLNLLLQWQLCVQQWGLDWDARHPESHIQVAALADAQNFVLGEKGMVAHLEAIQFEYTDEEAAEAMAILEAAKAG